MIRVVGANPAVDHTQRLDTLALDSVNRSAAGAVMAGGKSMIVARTIRRLGSDVATYGFLGGHTGKMVRDECKQLGIEDRHTPIKGATRINTIIVEGEPPRSTVINDPGPMVTPQEASNLASTLQSDCGPGDLVLMSGSLARGLNSSFYGDLVGAVQLTGAKTVIDTSGDALAMAAAARPWMIKPNLDEFSQLVGQPFSAQDPGDIVAAMGRFVRNGISVVIVTLGEAGLLFAGEGGTELVRPPVVDVANPTGSGDSFLGGFATALGKGRDITEAVELGVACGAANAQSVFPELDPDLNLEDLLSRVNIAPVTEMTS